MKTHSEKLMDLLFEDDLSKVLEFTKECAIQDAQRSWGYAQGFDGDIGLEAQHGALAYHKMFRPVRPYGDLYHGGVPIYETLEDTCSAALSILKSYDSTVVF